MLAASSFGSPVKTFTGRSLGRKPIDKGLRGFLRYEVSRTTVLVDGEAPRQSAIVMDRLKSRRQFG